MLLLQQQTEQLSQSFIIDWIYLYKWKQMTLKCNLFYVMMNYNVFIHYDVENNVLKEKIFTVKNKVKKLYSDRKTLLQWWKNVVVSQIKSYNQKHISKIFNRNNLILFLMKNLK